MWIPKLLIEEIHLKEKSKLASKLDNPKSSFAHKSFNPPSNSTSYSKSILGPIALKCNISHPSFPSSILGPYVHKSTFDPSSKSKPLPLQLHHPSRCVPMLIFPTFPSIYPQFFQNPVHYSISIFHNLITLIQCFE